jgi:hypothetical protein
MFHILREHQVIVVSVGKIEIGFYYLCAEYKYKKSISISIVNVLIENIKRTYITKTTVKYIQRTIVFIIVHVMNKIFHFHLYTISLIVLSTFKSLVTILFSYSLIEKQN